jgi:hypothetical protein
MIDLPYTFFRCAGNLARTKAVDADLVLHVGKTLVHLDFHVLGRDYDLDFALQPFSERFDNLHVFLPSFRGGRAQTPFVSMSTTPESCRAWLVLNSYSFRPRRNGACYRAIEGHRSVPRLQALGAGRET